ncbi:transglutaminase domain-containing protein [Streptococcus pacificus]|uniref:Transglutaminase-like domain-containing protein n=1 Tax=Streptococcus pacificus TaxID=2740577 RepID=A0ABS0ZJQ9_9STRE|nr:transglutaminase domain-containing protein [Streptococcus pacificus]MBJ8326255.1 hypothetical protein [Streptococcus pacificus]
MRKLRYVLLLCLAIVLSGCSNTNPFYNKQDISSNSYLANQINDDEFDLNYANPVIIMQKSQELGLTKKFYFQQLNDKEKYAYIQIVEGFENYQSNIKINKVSDESILKVRQALTLDNPKYFWSRNLKQIKTLDNEYLEMVYDIPNNAKDTKEEIESIADNVIKNMPNGSDYDKVKYLYEYVITNTEYNEQASNNQDIRSVFLTQSSVCMGYSLSFEYLADKAGIESFLAVGKFTNSTLQSDMESSGFDFHAWNGVKINGNYYWVDTTWGDTAMDHPEIKFSENPIDYSYLCVTDDVINRSRQLDNNLDSYFNYHIETSQGIWQFPQFTDSSLDYYKRQGQTLDTFDSNQFNNYIINQIDSGKTVIELAFSNEANYKAALNYLNTNNISQLLADHYQTRIATRWIYQNYSYRINLEVTK